MSTQTKISVVIPTHNRCDLLSQTLGSLGAVRLPDGDQTLFEVIVVANACTDATVTTVKSVASQRSLPVQCVVEPEAGLNVARNRGVRESSGDIIALIDDDVLLDSQWLLNLAAAYREFPADIVGGRVDLWWEAVPKPDWFEGEHRDVFASLLSGLDMGSVAIEVEGRQSCGIGANFSFRRKVFDAVGGFRSGLDRIGSRLLGGGEIDFARRAGAAGFRRFYVPNVRLKHWVSPNRTAPKYLCGVAGGSVAGEIYASPRFGMRQAARVWAGAAFRVPQRTLAAALAQRKGQQAAALCHRIKRAQSIAGAKAAARRMLGGSPVQPAD